MLEVFDKYSKDKVKISENSVFSKSPLFSLFHKKANKVPYVSFLKELSWEILPGTNHCDF